MTQPREPLVGYHITCPNAVFVEPVEPAPPRVISVSVLSLATANKCCPALGRTPASTTKGTQ
jgi:hypothetical protein